VAETNVVGEAGVLGVTVRTVGRDEKRVTRERAAVAQKECRRLVVWASGTNLELSGLVAKVRASGTPSGLVVKVLASGSTLETSGLVVKVLASGSTLESGLVVKVQASGNILEPSGLVKVRASGNILEASGLVKAKIQASGILEPSGLVKAKVQASGSILEPSGLVKAKVQASGNIMELAGTMVKIVQWDPGVLGVRAVVDGRHKVEKMVVGEQDLNSEPADPEGIGPPLDLGRLK